MKKQQSKKVANHKKLVKMARASLRRQRVISMRAIRQQIVDDAKTPEPTGLPASYFKTPARDSSWMLDWNAAY